MNVPVDKAVPETVSDTLPTERVTPQTPAGCFYWNDGKGYNDERWMCEQSRIDNAGIGRNHRLAR